MKLISIIILSLYIVYSTATACTATCAADKCCSTTEAAATPQTCTTSMLNAAGTAYVSQFTVASTDKTCATITVAAGSCVKSDFTYAAAAATECVDAKLSCITMATNPYTQGFTTTEGKVCKALVAKTSCVDSTSKLWTDLSGQTVATTSPKCVLDTGVCASLFSSGTTYGYGWKGVGDFTCVQVVTTDTAPICVDPLTHIASSAALTTGTKVCALASDNSCQLLAYENGAVRYTLVASKFTCAITTTTGLLCGTAVCAPTHCCVGTTCTLAQDTTKNCLTSSSSITCLAQTTAQYYYNAKDASCVDPTTLTTNKVHCIDGTNKVLKTLVAADNKCINTDKTCTATTTTLTTTAADDFNCKTVTETTTTTTTTSGNIIYLVGTFLILVSTILI